MKTSREEQPLAADQATTGRPVQFQHTVLVVNLEPWFARLAEQLDRAPAVDEQADLDRVYEECEAQAQVVHELEAWLDPLVLKRN